jgi:hypothetical protein
MDKLAVCENDMDEDLKSTVTAFAPNSPGPFSELAQQVQAESGAACAALVIIQPDGNGAYSVSGPLEVQLAMPDLLEQVAKALRIQLVRSVQ